MNITAPLDLRELRGTAVIFEVSVKVKDGALLVRGTVEFHPVYPADEPEK